MSRYGMTDSGKRQSFGKNMAIRDTTDDKPRPDLISPFAEERQGHWLRMGAVKYAERNWEKGMPFSRCVASLKRHLMKYQQGNQNPVVKPEKDARLTPARQRRAHFPQAVAHGTADRQSNRPTKLNLGYVVANRALVLARQIVRLRTRRVALLNECWRPGSSFNSIKSSPIQR